MYITIFIFLVIIAILAIDIKINVKSVNDTLKIDASIGLIRFVIPHQRLIEKAIKSEKLKSSSEQKNDLINLLNNRHYLNRLFKHCSLSLLYIARFTDEQLYLNPIQNGVYLMVSNQLKAYCFNHFKMVDDSKIKLIYDEQYENIDYYLSVKTDLISLLTTILIRK